MYPTQPIQDLIDKIDHRQSFDYVLVADDTDDIRNVLSDAVHMAHKAICTILVYYRGETIKVGKGSTYSDRLMRMKDKLEDPPDKDPAQSDFPDERQ